MYRYYLTQRPAMPGTFPKPQGNRVLSIENYDERTFCEEIGREAAKRLIGSIEKPKTTLLERVVIEGILVAGKSVGRI